MLIMKKKNQQTTAKAWKITQHAKLHRFYMIEKSNWLLKIFCLNLSISCYDRFISVVGKLPVKWTSLLVSSADDLCKQIGPRSGPTKCRAWSWSKLFDTLMVFLKEFFEKVQIEKNQQTTKKHEKLPSRQRVEQISWWNGILYFLTLD